MRVLIAAGGTAGHINPALAIAGAIKKADPSAEIHFAGRKEGMEYRLVGQAGYPFHHIHATGGFGWEWMPELLRKDGLDLPHTPSIDMREYIYDMPVEMAAADIVISRSGAATCNEIAVSGTPSILIPSPNVTNNHQERNARVLSDRNAAVTIVEKDCTAQVLFDEIGRLLADPERRENMSKTLKTMARVDSTQRICDIVEELTKA